MSADWSTISDVAREFARWWLEELRAIAALAFPRVARTGPGPRLIRDEDGWRLAFSDDRTIQELEPGQHAASAFDLAIPINDCLVRRLSLPAAARNKLEAMARLDLERATPFKASEVHSAVSIDAYDRDNRQLRISQYVIKRDRLSGLLDEAKAAGFEVRALLAFPDDDRTKTPVMFGTGPDLLKRSSPRLLLGALAGLAVCLSMSALLLHASWRQEFLDRLDAAIERQRNLAKSVLEAVERNKSEAEKLNAIAKEVLGYRPVVVVLDDVTRLMPDDVWVTSLNVSGSRVELSGFAPSAANLVKLIEASASFSGPALTSPIMYDRGQGKEQFTLAFDRRVE